MTGRAGSWKTAECISLTTIASMKESSKRAKHTERAQPYILEANHTLDFGRKVELSSSIVIILDRSYCSIAFALATVCRTLWKYENVTQSDCTGGQSSSPAAVRCTKGPSNLGGVAGRESSLFLVDSLMVRSLVR